MDMSKWLVEKFPNKEYKIVKNRLPKSLVWFGSLFNSQARLVYGYWGLENTFDNTLSKDILKIEYLPIKEAV